MLAVGEKNVTRRFAFFKNSKLPAQLQPNNRHGPAYCFVDFGFFDLVPYPMLPIMVVGHILHFYGLYLTFTLGLWNTLISSALFMLWGGLGITAGAHRLWCHRSYKASLPMRIFLMIGQSIAGQYSIYGWAKGHRTHHKFADTEADPHNVKRGFTFSHLGWLVLKEHPMADIKGNGIDFSDILADPVARLQDEYYGLCYFIFAFMMPVVTPMILFNESLWHAFLIGYVMRFVTQTHDTALVNSAAHMYGDKPYNDKLHSSENPWVSVAAIGEGYHNYHHAYPWDYGTGEQGNKFNVTKMFIDVASFFGLTYNLRQASQEMIQKGREKAINNNCTESDEF